MATLSYILDRVRRRFNRTDRNLEEMLANDLPSFVKQVCSNYPFSFLSVRPSDVFPVRAWTEEVELYDGTGVADWVDQGWLLLQPGVSTYRVWVPGTYASPVNQDDFDKDEEIWAPANVRNIEYIKRFSAEGTFEQDLYVVTPDLFYSQSTYGPEDKAAPIMSMLLRGPTFSSIRFHPIPDEEYYMCIGLNLLTPPSYGEGGETTNAMFQFYPEVAITAALLFAAEYFGDAPAVAYYTQKLYGSPPKGSNESTAPSGGLIGDMKKDSRRQDTQKTMAVAVSTGTREAIGRAGLTVERSPRHGFYIY